MNEWTDKDIAVLERIFFGEVFLQNWQPWLHAICRTCNMNHTGPEVTILDWSKTHIENHLTPLAEQA